MAIHQKSALFITVGMTWDTKHIALILGVHNTTTIIAKENRNGKNFNYVAAGK